MSKVEKALVRIIDQLLAVNDGERDMYAYIRDLLIHRELGIGLSVEQVVIDSTIGRNSGAPDLAAYSSRNGKVIKSPDHLVAVFELKLGDGILKRETAVFQEKIKYVQSGTRYFFLIDQHVVSRRDVEHDLNSPPNTYTWNKLRDLETFRECFGVIGRNQLKLEDELERFVAGTTRFAYRDIDRFGRRKFIATIRQVSQSLHEAVENVVNTRIKDDLQEGNRLIEEMEQMWGERRIDPAWNTRDGHPVEFARNVDESDPAPLTVEEVERYQHDHDTFAIQLEPHQYALEIEYSTLPRYASRLGVDGVISLRTTTPASRKVVESFIYETASLILSRMLMIRFSEDHEFMVRHISNGGVSTFANYAKHFRKPYQALLRQTYENARALYRGLFDPVVLDWVLAGDEKPLSDSILHAMYLLSRWDFRTARGDILSGVYDHYLETSKRRELGEVFTRPEIARYILARCGFQPGLEQSILDPACGTGTFVVEALEAELERLRKAGLLNLDTVKNILPRLCGLDINPFSVSLAQIQVLWHLMELFGKNGTASKVATGLLPLLNIEGGTSSLEAMGIPMAQEAQTGLSLDMVRPRDRRKHATRFPTRFRRINGGKYDIVAGNPPYVRAHRRSAGTLQEDYQEVAKGQFDLYLLFIYRAMRSWVKPGGRMGFIVPIAMLDAGYAAPLRSVLLEYKLIEIVDLEQLRKKTFHGVKRPTVVLIIQNSPGSNEDLVTVTTVPPEAYMADEDSVNMGRATSCTLRRGDLLQERYLGAVAHASWRPMVDYAAGAQTEWSTKVKPDDVAVLAKIGAADRLASLVRTAYRRKVGKERVVERQIPTNDKPSNWDAVLLVGEGLKLGGKGALGAAGPAIYKGQNIFPGGVIGQPMGKWNRDKELSKNLYLYESCFDADALFAVREISHLPVACRVPAGAVFQNTAYIIQLEEQFPLDVWCMSRIVQFYAAKVMRSTVIEDLGAHWYKRQIVLLPVPTHRTTVLREALEAAGRDVVDADRDIADRYRRLDVLASAGARTLVECFVKADPRAAGLDMINVPDVVSPLVDVREDGECIVTNDLLFRLVVPHQGLRTFILFQLKRRLAEGEVATICKSEISALEIPANLEPALAEISEIEKQDVGVRFTAARDALDVIAAEALGLSQSEQDYILREMATDSFLKQLSILWEHRGPRVQAYSDSEGEDRYD